ncbi:hypothetical protein [Methylobacterium oryzisoli]|uniref:hypothetical protein n=1 Tax=Methylobacterium oryzisoli TaxID=3385502 RepID=UPI0038913626
MTSARLSPDLFAVGAERLVYGDAVALTLQSPLTHGPQHRHWGIESFAGGHAHQCSV